MKHSPAHIKEFIMTATATPEFHEFYCIDRDDEANRAMERGEFKPLHLVMDVTTGTRWSPPTPLVPMR